MAMGKRLSFSVDLDKIPLSTRRTWGSGLNVPIVHLNVNVFLCPGRAILGKGCYISTDEMPLCGDTTEDVLVQTDFPALILSGL